MIGFNRVSIEDERRFQQQHIASLREQYLSTDVITRLERDEGYREKVQMIRAALPAGVKRVLDIGANTCGESQALAEGGLEIIAADINEVALGVAQSRQRKFDRKPMHYMACDGHNLPVADGSVDAVIVIEALHHMDDPARTASEISRVLRPGGYLVTFEPYAYNPYRRLSEIRDFFRGTKEYSFTVRQLNRLFRGAGMRPVSVEKVVLRPSSWKNTQLSTTHAFLRRFYYRVSKRLPWIFGALLYVAQKPGNGAESTGLESFENTLRCPISKAPVMAVEGGFVSDNKDDRYLYPAHEGIPVLIKTDAKLLTPETWESLRRKATKAAPAQS